MYRCVRLSVSFNRGIVPGRNFTGNSASPDNQTRIADYYAGKSIFITGVTGFLGKVLVERLLYNCKDIDKIFVLIRPKKGEDVRERLNNIVNVPLFSKLKKERPGSIDKIIAVEGNMLAPELGIKMDDQRKLTEQVSLVFHSAATVRFADTFKYTMDVNLEGTQRLIDLSKNMKKLDTFVYISTAFSNPDKIVIEEKLYPPPKSIDEVRYFAREFAHDEKKVKKFLGDYPNNYTFSKAICEDLVNREKGDMPTVIVRPAIVTPSIRDPIPGWADSWVAATTIMANMAKGYTPVLYGRNDVIVDIIPVDYVSNLLILAGAKGNRNKDVKVYNICSSDVNPLTWKQSCDLFLEESKKYGYSTNNEREVIMSLSVLKIITLTYLYKTIPYFFADVSLVLRGKKPRHLKEQARAVWLRDLTSKFTSTSWTMKCNKSLALFGSLHEADRKIFPCDPKSINWKEYFRNFCKGVSDNLLNKSKPS